MDSLSLTRFGSHGWLIRFTDHISEDSLARCRGLLAAFDENPLPGLRDVVPAYREVLLEFDEGVEESAIREILRRAKPLPAAHARLHEIPVRYDGPDLAELAASRGLSVSGVVERHTAPVYSVYLIGFSPGFPYLGPLDPVLHTPRLPRPRARVPRGSVAIGGEHTGIYSITSPGGWRIIGHTDTDLFSPLGDGNAFLLRQGDRVKLVPVP